MRNKKYYFCLLLFCVFFTSNTIYSKSQVVFSISTFFPTDDSYVAKDTPSLNYGNETLFRFGKDHISYIKFAFNTDLDTILKAKISLYLKSESSSNLEILIGKTSINWDEDDIIWDNKPIVSDTLFQLNISGNSINEYELEVTEIITDNILSLCLYTESHNGYGLSKEYSNESLIDDTKVTLTYESKDIEVRPSIPGDLTYTFFFLIGTILVIIFYKTSRKNKL